MLKQIASTFLLLSAVCHDASAYERDIHVGLTRWLARAAGFDDGQAEAISIGDGVADSGSMETTEVPLEIGCFMPNRPALQHFYDLHYPASLPLPSSDAFDAHAAIVQLERNSKSREGALLYRFGILLHTIQDSHAHSAQTRPTFDHFPYCRNPSNSSEQASSSLSRSGYEPVALQKMALSTYLELKGYPAIDGVRRMPVPDEKVVAEIATFVTAVKSKSSEQEWFRHRGIDDTAFLDGASIPDGASYVPAAWHGDKLPPLRLKGSLQEGVPNEIKEEVEGFFHACLVLAGSTCDAYRSRTKAVTGKARRADQLGLWLARDHGTASMLENRGKNATYPKSIWSHDSKRVKYGSVNEAFLPVMERLSYPSPILPYIIHQLPESRVAVVARLRHAPYEDVGFIFDWANQRLSLIDIISVVNH